MEVITGEMIDIEIGYRTLCEGETGFVFDKDIKYKINKYEMDAMYILCGVGFLRNSKYTNVDDLIPLLYRVDVIKILKWIDNQYNQFDKTIKYNGGVFDLDDVSCSVSSEDIAFYAHYRRRKPALELIKVIA